MASEGRRAVTVEVVALHERHAPRWRVLFQGYADFYGRPSDDAHKAAVWGWLMDPAHVLEGYVAVQGGQPVGLAHVRPMPSPLRGQDVGFLDDLFVDPAARGGRVGEALLAFLADLARQRGWPVIRWITADDNYRARTLYDRVASKTSWNLYEMVAAR
jgi:GNAT superfamily N-acetyltransferase